MENMAACSWCLHKGRLCYVCTQAGFSNDLFTSARMEFRLFIVYEIQSGEASTIRLNISFFPRLWVKQILIFCVGYRSMASAELFSGSWTAF
jgi:hypothetical protein